MASTIKHISIYHPLDILTREQFNALALKREDHTCLFCSNAATEVHHILDRKLYPDTSGYFLHNAVAVCNDHHLLCEAMTITPEDIRTKLDKLENIIVPPLVLTYFKKNKKFCDYVSTFNLRANTVSRINLDSPCILGSDVDKWGNLIITTSFLVQILTNLKDRIFDSVFYAISENAWHYSHYELIANLQLELAKNTLNTEKVTQLLSAFEYKLTGPLFLDTGFNKFKKLNPKVMYISDVKLFNVH